MGDNPNNPASRVSWLPVNPNALKLPVQRKTNIIFTEWVYLVQRYFQ